MVSCVAESNISQPEKSDNCDKMRFTGNGMSLKEIKGDQVEDHCGDLQEPTRTDNKPRVVEGMWKKSSMSRNASIRLTIWPLERSQFAVQYPFGQQ